MMDKVCANCTHDHGLGYDEDVCAHCIDHEEWDPVEDQSIKTDIGKPKLTLVPRQIIYDIAEVREYGNHKYPDGGPDNWKQVEVQRYRDAAFRHLLLYLDDPSGVDEESGISHLSHLACNIAFLCELEVR